MSTSISSGVGDLPCFITFISLISLSPNLVLQCTLNYPSTWVFEQDSVYCFDYLNTSWSQSGQITEGALYS